jgi:hypothetical protein
VGSRSLENEKMLKYFFELTVRNQNYVDEEIKSWINSRHAFFHSFQNSFDFPPAIERHKE